MSLNKLQVLTQDLGLNAYIENLYTEIHDSNERKNKQEIAAQVFEELAELNHELERKKDQLSKKENELIDFERDLDHKFKDLEYKEKDIIRYLLSFLTNF